MVIGSINNKRYVVKHGGSYKSNGKVWMAMGMDEIFKGNIIGSHYGS